MRFRRSSGPSPFWWRLQTERANRIEKRATSACLSDPMVIEKLARAWLRVVKRCERIKRDPDRVEECLEAARELSSIIGSNRSIRTWRDVDAVVELAKVRIAHFDREGWFTTASKARKQLDRVQRSLDAARHSPFPAERQRIERFLASLPEEIPITIIQLLGAKFRGEGRTINAKRLAHWLAERTIRWTVQRAVYSFVRFEAAHETKRRAKERKRKARTKEKREEAELELRWPWPVEQLARSPKQREVFYVRAVHRSLKQEMPFYRPPYALIARIASALAGKTISPDRVRKAV